MERRVITIKVYSTLSRALELGPHNQRQFSIISRISLCLVSLLCWGYVVHNIFSHFLYYFLKLFTIFLCLHTDINECEDDNGGCSHQCINSKGSYECACWPGHNLLEDKKMCSGKCIISIKRVYLLVTTGFHLERFSSSSRRMLRDRCREDKQSLIYHVSSFNVTKFGWMVGFTACQLLSCYLIPNSIFFSSNYKVFVSLSNTNNLYVFIWFQVLLSNTNIHYYMVSSIFVLHL